MGTDPRGGEGMTFGELSVEEARANSEKMLLAAFFLQRTPVKRQGKR